MIYLEHILEATNGALIYHGKQHRFDTFCHDTRQLIPGEMFVAVRGEQGDGHDYLLDAVGRGAARGSAARAGDRCWAGQWQPRRRRPWPRVPGATIWPW